MAHMCCYFLFLMHITFFFFLCGELHCNFSIQIILTDLVSYCIVCNCIVCASYEYFHQANKVYYYYSLLFYLDNHAIIIR